MTTGRQFSESEGTFIDADPVPHRMCQKCKRLGQVVVQAWDSSDGAYRDFKFTCLSCGHVWWVDGIDS